MLNIQKLKFHSRQRGLSLVEAMIALLVISIGLLGIAALQITSMKQNNSALHHSQAVWVGFNIAERIRANFGEFANYGTPAIDTDIGYTQDCSGGCSSAQMITSDASEWTTEVQKLPSGRGIIDSPFANQIRIKVMWDDEGTGVTGTGCTSAASDLTCYMVTLER